jgi:hypothetical protein
MMSQKTLDRHKRKALEKQQKVISDAERNIQMIETIPANALLELTIRGWTRGGWQDAILIAMMNYPSTAGLNMTWLASDAVYPMEYHQARTVSIPFARIVSWKPIERIDLIKHVGLELKTNLFDQYLKG